MATDFETILDRHLNGDFAVFTSGRDAPSLAVLRSFEKTLGYELPADFREFSTSPLGGLYVEAKEEVWPRPVAYEVGPFWSFLYGFFVYGFAADIPEWMDMRIQTPKFQREAVRLGATDFHTPFLKVIGNTNVYCFTAEQSIVQWDHETGSFAPIEGGFTALLEQEIIELWERTKEKKAGARQNERP